MREDSSKGRRRVYLSMNTTRRISIPRVVAVLPAIMPSTTIGVAKPLMKLHREGHLNVTLTLESLASRRHVVKADLIVFCRNCEPAGNNAFRWSLELKKPMIYEIDDNFFAIPLEVPGGIYHRSPERLEQLSQYLESADLVRVYSEGMRRRALSINPAVERVEGPLDWSLVPPLRVDRGRPGKIRIVYATSRLKDELETIFLGGVERFLEAFPDRAELFLWGYRSDRFAGHPSVKFLKYVNDYDLFFRKFAHSGFDIGLAPLPDDEFHLSKSNNKFREYAACRIAGIYSDVPVYSECVQDGVTGLLVENRPDAWFEALKRLVQDEDLRFLILEKAQQYARTHYNQENSSRVWLDQIHRVLSQRLDARGGQTTELTQFGGERTRTATDALVDRAATIVRGLLRAIALARDIRTNGFRNTINAVKCAAKDWLLLRRFR
jgi:glycosyltransferase involved in cell wall biosynthesis